MDRERTYSWVRDRLQELRDGTLSEADRLRLKELAMRDPFIHDAVEGYDLSAHHDHAPHLEYLSNRIQEKNAVRRKKLLPTRRTWIMQAVAASLALILVTWAVIYYLNLKPNVIQIADTTDVYKNNEQSEPPVINQSPSESKSITEAYQEGSEEPSGLRENAETKAKEYLEEDVVVKPKSPPPIAESGGATTFSMKKQDAAKMEEAPRMNDAYATLSNPQPQETKITGKIIDPDGLPVTGAFIALQHSNLMTTSNNAGRFELNIPSATSKVEVLTTSYKDTLISLSPGLSDLVVQLTAPKFLPESSKSEPGVALQADAESEGLMETAFQTYLQLNSRFPLAETFSNNSKYVHLEFVVNKNFRPANIQVLQSNANEIYQKEAVRLIGSGPDWICEKNPPCVQQYTMYFR